LFSADELKFGKHDKGAKKISDILSGWFVTQKGQSCGTFIGPGTAGKRLHEK
jgi:hypothetical protein